MGIFDSVLRALGGLGSLSDEELADRHEALRVRSDEDHYEELHRLDAEMVRRANKAYNLENPGPHERRHREHG